MPETEGEGTGGPRTALVIGRDVEQIVEADRDEEAVGEAPSVN